MSDPTYTGNANVAIGVVRGRVHFELPPGINWVAMDPDNARRMGEELARKAYEAHTGRPAGAGSSGLADRIRERMVNRVTLMMTSMAASKLPIHRQAQAIVDAVLQEAT